MNSIPSPLLVSLFALFSLSLGLTGCEGLFYDLDGVAEATDAANDVENNGDINLEELAAQVGDTFEAIGTTNQKTNAPLCECLYDDPDIGDYASEEECLEDRSLPADNVTYWAGCIENAVLDHGQESPEGSEAYFSCVRDTHIDVHSCISNIDTDFDDQCSDGALAQLFYQCLAPFDGDDEICSDELSQEIREWRAAINDIATDRECPINFN